MSEKLYAALVIGEFAYFLAASIPALVELRKAAGKGGTGVVIPPMFYGMILGGSVALGLRFFLDFLHALTPNT